MKNENTKLNIPLFKKIRKRIAEIPESYDQTVWFTENDKAPCGTAGCLAGEAIICGAQNLTSGIAELRFLDKVNWEHGGYPVAKRAAILLGLPEPRFIDYANDAAARLFDSNYIGTNQWSVRWPEPFKSRYEKAKTNRGRASAAVAYLDFIIKNKRLE